MEVSTLNRKLFSLLVIIALVLAGCTVPYSEFDRELLVVNQEIKEDKAEEPATTTTSAEREIVKLATGEWAPYVSESLENQGFSTELIKAAFNEVDMDVELEFMSWTRAFELTEAGEVFGTYPWSFTEERAPTFNFSSPVVKSDENFFFLKGTPGIPNDFTTLDALQGIKIGGVDSYSHIDIL